MLYFKINFQFKNTVIQRLRVEIFEESLQKKDKNKSSKVIFWSWTLQPFVIISLDVKGFLVPIETENR